MSRRMTMWKCTESFSKTTYYTLKTKLHPKEKCLIARGGFLYKVRFIQYRS